MSATRFVDQAVAAWRHFPRQIASDLSQYHGIRISEWHQGPPEGLSSYELLELLEYMDDDGRYKAAARVAAGGNRWSERTWAIMATANESAVMRAGHFPNADSDQYGGRLFIPDYLAVERAERMAEAESARGSIYDMADIRRQPGYEDWGG